MVGSPVPVLDTGLGIAQNSHADYPDYDVWRLSRRGAPDWSTRRAGNAKPSLCESHMAGLQGLRVSPTGADTSRNGQEHHFGVHRRVEVFGLDRVVMTPHQRVAPHCGLVGRRRPSLFHARRPFGEISPW
jgi:hypothetical protein